MTSVVIPVLGDGPALAQQLPRIVALHGEKEIVIADGGGGDAADPAHAFESARAHGATIVRSRAGRGPQMNAGAARARGDALLFLHADCWLDEDALVEGGRRLDDPEVGAVVFRQRIEGARLAYRWIERAAALRATVLRTPYGDSGLLVRRRDFERIGGFPEIPLCEDLGIARKLRRLGRIALARSRIHVSARRWEERGVVRTTLLNWCIATAFEFGVAPDRLYRLYYGRSLPR